jgi:hypothetical protein
VDEVGGDRIIVVEVSDDVGGMTEEGEGSGIDDDKEGEGLEVIEGAERQETVGEGEGEEDGGWEGEVEGAVW